MVRGKGPGQGRNDHGEARNPEKWCRVPPTAHLSISAQSSRKGYRSLRATLTSLWNYAEIPVEVKLRRRPVSVGVLGRIGTGAWRIGFPERAGPVFPGGAP